MWLRTGWQGVLPVPQEHGLCRLHYGDRSNLRPPGRHGRLPDHQAREGHQTGTVTISYINLSKVFAHFYSYFPIRNNNIMLAS